MAGDWIGIDNKEEEKEGGKEMVIQTKGETSEHKQIPVERKIVTVRQTVGGLNQWEKMDTSK